MLPIPGANQVRGAAATGNQEHVRGFEAREPVGEARSQVRQIEQAAAHFDDDVDFHLKSDPASTVKAYAHAAMDFSGPSVSASDITLPFRKLFCWPRTKRARNSPSPASTTVRGGSGKFRAA